jgi:hypothetical protein
VGAYRSAIDLTTRGIECRARYFRNQVVAVALLMCVSVAVALAARSAVPLLGMVLVVPVCGMFLAADHRVLGHWRSELLTAWAMRDLDMAAFRNAIRANPALPRETTEAMLATLPIAGDLTAERLISTPTRRAIAAESLARHRSHADAIGFKAATAGIAGCALLGAFALRRWEPLVSLAGLVLVPIGDKYLIRRRRSELERELAACRAQPDFSETDYANYLGA